MPGSAVPGGSRPAAAFVFLAGLAFLGTSFWNAWEAAHLLRNGERAAGIVVLDRPGAATVTPGHPTIEFTTAAGTTARFRQNGFGPSEVGAPVEVLYLASDPAGTATMDGWPLWSVAVWTLPAGLAFTVLPLLGAPVAFRWRRF